jgi:hypothetical protein
MADDMRPSRPPARSAANAEADPEVISLWRLPVFGHKLHSVPVYLVPTLSKMAAQVPDTPLGYRVSYERSHALLVLASVASKVDAASFPLGDPPSALERELGVVIGQAFHQGWPLAEVAVAARMPAELVVAIGKRTIRRKGWLTRL